MYKIDPEAEMLGAFNLPSWPSASTVSRSCRRHACFQLISCLNLTQCAPRPMAWVSAKPSGANRMCMFGSCQGEPVA
jgi:hypothetical protein